MEKWEKIGKIIDCVEKSVKKVEDVLYCTVFKVNPPPGESLLRIRHKVLKL